MRHLKPARNLGHEWTGHYHDLKGPIGNAAIVDKEGRGRHSRTNPVCHDGHDCPGGCHDSGTHCSQGLIRERTTHTADSGRFVAVTRGDGECPSWQTDCESHPGNTVPAGEIIWIDRRILPIRQGGASPVQ